MIFIYITNPSKKEAKRIASHLLKKRLIACANIFSVDSLYWWKGKIKEIKEFVLIAKTLEEKFEKVKEEIIRTHKYTVPCITRIEVAANKSFEEWVKKEVG